MPQLIFDIETFGQDLNTLPASIQKTLLGGAETDEEKEGVLARTGLCPLSGEIITLAMFNPETNKAKVYFQAPVGLPADGVGGVTDYEKDGAQYQVKTEKEILSSFWQDVKFYDQLISFNGRGFDCPFIIFRSLFHNLMPTKNLMPNRYYNAEHLDLLDWLTFYGAFRKFSLAALCEFLQIKNPKDEGVSGLAINELFKNKEYQKIAEYCLRDVMATKELYQKIKPFIF